MYQRRIVFFIFVFAAASCNLPNRTVNTLPASPTADATLSASSTPTLIPIETLVARATPTFVPTATPRLTLASPINQPVNCRYGPSTAYAVVGSLEVNG